MKKINLLLLSVFTVSQLASLSPAFAKGPSNTELFRKFDKLNADFQVFKAQPKKPAQIISNITPVAKPAPARIISPLRDNPISPKELIKQRQAKELEQNRAKVAQMRAEQAKVREEVIQNLKARRQLVIDQAKKDKALLQQRKQNNSAGAIKDPEAEAKRIVNQVIRQRKQQLAMKAAQPKPAENPPQVKAAQSIKPVAKLNTQQQLDEVKKFVRQVKAYKFRNKKA